MKNSSEPIDYIAGTGQYTVKMDIAELQLIAAVLNITRLGKGSIYRTATRKLLLTISDELFDEDFLGQAAKEVNLYVSVVDADGNIIAKHHNDEICVEV